ncbi:ClpXP protease specificity-enhancing factor [Candidatus Endoriftia persephonae]|jgi:stringent starvation protein B|uniref:Stringent starvation protein B n=3 Tax=Gammaproteobacteria TaxID=1236 RepID=G2FDU3_9GAMM|nr:ClpXP protease specificity-enhancing factor [Candidatus Endoriftia persephone]EGW54927.1 stringent starvation protein B [endosymbiont of Tevnia jerichonana (vent Tica)]USF87917.1 ClpXP protease specificity-enhancing factor [Candidatus Endoriftia persephone]
MTSNRPYLIRALYEWLVDNALTPYLLVDADHEAVEVPQQFVSEGRIVLNIAPDAVVGLELGNEWISFSARFAGHPQAILVPPAAVLGIYAKENGQGMLFPEELEQEQEQKANADDKPEPPKPGKRPALKVIK